MSEIYNLQNVRQQYGDRVVLDVPSFTVEESSIVGLLGHNGSGKSTLLRLLAFLESPSEGKLFYDNLPVEDRLDGFRREVTLLTQDPYLLKRNVFGNVAYGLQVRGRKNIQQKVFEALEMVGLSPAKFAERKWYELSGGEAQRVALAARLAINPRVLLLDEPTASVDTESSELIYKAALSVRNNYGCTLVVVSHDKDWLIRIADVTWSVSDGKVRMA
ncbi:energy-coupling factor ABC transporter ATP-binding protein [Maridesulfovibrio bastinii]|uniref:energy-coupling factor ABC transporter ATP-binding protein n=1 Tax=Maridesulfovibrio bastinii TaxID=47157 RepID=UPI0003FD480D|nr:ABC transporter ATP-binding protein [Maridesulfovibrio bastinii]